MGRRGPAPAPSRIQALSGETRPSRVNYEEPLPSSTRPPEPPKDMEKEAKTVWRHVIKHMPEGVILEVDREALRAYCEAVVSYHRHRRVLLDSGPIVRGVRSGDLITNPMARLVREEREAMRLWARELGLTPSARANLRIDPSTNIGSLEALGPRLVAVGE